MRPDLRPHRRAVLLGLSALAACAAPAPPEFAAYDGAMRAAAAATAEFLRVYRPYEARVSALAAAKGAPSDGPPLSDRVALGFDAAAALGETLGRYAAGTEFSQIGADLAALERDARAIAALVAGPAGSLAVGSSAALLGAAVDGVATAANAERFEAAVAENAPDVGAFLTGLRTDVAPLMAQVAETAIAESERAAQARNAPRDATRERAAFAAALAAWTGAVAATEDALAALTRATAGRSRFLSAAEAAEAGAALRAKALEAGAAARALDAVLEAGR
jgi:hypothetical protein